MKRKIKSFSCHQGEMFDSYVIKVNDNFIKNPGLAEEIEFKTFLEFFSPKKTEQILDLGCGYGRYSLKMAKYVKKIFGLDVSAKSIQISKKIAKKNGITNYRGIISDFSKPYIKGFDTIYSINTFHHIDDIDSFLDNIKLSLRKSGRLVLFEFNPLNPLFIPFLIKIKQVKSHFNTSYIRSNLPTLELLLIKHGFRRTKLKRYAFFPTYLYNKYFFVKKLNEWPCMFPLINWFCAFHMLEYKI